MFGDEAAASQKIRQVDDRRGELGVGQSVEQAREQGGRPFDLVAPRLEEGDQGQHRLTFLARRLGRNQVGQRGQGARRPVDCERPQDDGPQFGRRLGHAVPIDQPNDGLRRERGFFVAVEPRLHDLLQQRGNQLFSAVAERSEGFEEFFDRARIVQFQGGDRAVERLALVGVQITVAAQIVEEKVPGRVIEFVVHVVHDLVITSRIRVL